MTRVLTCRFFYYLFLIVNCIAVPDLNASGNNTADSLYQIISTSKEDSNIVKSYKDLAWEFAYTDVDSAIYFCRKALSISFKIDYDKGVGDCFNSMGSLYYIKNQYDSALYFHNKAIDKVIKLKNNRILASAYSNISLTCNILCEYKKAIEYGYLALEIREKQKDTLGISKSLNNIGTTYHYMGRFDDALNYYSRALELKEHIGDKRDISATLSNIGLIYFEKGINESSAYFDSSLMYHNKALKYRKEIKFKEGMAESYINIGNTFSETDNTDKALTYYKLAEKVFSELENSAGLATLLYNIAYLYYKDNKPGQAIKNYNESLALAKKINNIDLIKENYNSLSELYALKKDYARAYEYSTKYNAIYDSIFTTEKIRQFEKIKNDYETQKKENLALKQDTNSKLSKLRITTSFLFMAVAIIIAITILLYFVIKSLKSSRKTTKLLVDQNVIITQKSDIINENINYARIIQTSLLPSHKDFKSLFPDSFVLSMPKDIVGGDFLWYRSIDDMKIVAMVDCTGHGVSAAFMSVIGNTILNKIILEEGIRKTSEILFKLNLYITGALIKQTDKGLVMDGMDIALCIIKDNRLIFSGSQMPICHISDGNLNVIKGTRFSIGGNILNKKCEFESEQIDLKKGDYIYLFTDGYYDQFGGEQYRPLRFKNFQNMLLSNHKLAMERQKEIFYNHIVVWIGKYEQLDDITLVGIKI